VVRASTRGSPGRFAAINIGYTSGVEIKNTKITNVIPMGLQGGIVIGTSVAASGAITGPILAKNWEIIPFIWW
jgi:hypothetical protein